MKKANEEIVYHYCSVDTFLSIVRSSVLRLTDIEKSNDYEERTYMERMIMDELKELFIYEELESILEYGYQSLYFMRRLYVCCFSEDGDTLSQWRAYGDDGCGIAIGFKRKYLEELNKDLYGLEFRKVEYNKDRHKEFAHAQALKILQAFRNGKNFIAAMADVYNNEILCNSCQKMPSFMEEKEWRVGIAMTPDIRGNVGGKLHKFGLSPMKMYSTGRDLITYMDLDFSAIKDDFLKNVVIGPSCKVSKQDIYTCLRLCGYQCEPDQLEVWRSEATYRV